MADTFTTYYNLTKPQIGGDSDTWGNLLNANFDAIDSQLHTASTYALPLTGGALTGAVTSSASITVGGGGSLAVDSATPAVRTFNLTTAGSMRWKLGTTAGAESGANAGSDFNLTAWTDAGAFLSTPLSVVRSTGVASFSARPVFAGNTPWDSGNFTPGNYATLSGATFTGNVQVNTSGSSGSFTVQDTGGFGANVTLRGNGGTTPNKSIRAQGGNLEIMNHGYAAVISTLTNAGVWSAADFQATSDERLKTNIRRLRRGLDELKRMPPVEYTKGDSEEIGFIAQEAREVIPEAVTEGDDGFLRLSYGQTLALVASAVLDLDARMTLAGI